MPDQHELTFKEMCTQFDVTPRTLRHYEYIELLMPRREGRSRIYGPKEVVRMRLILRAKKFGFSLEEIRQWFLIYDNEGTDQQLQIWIEAAAGRLDSLRSDRDSLNQTIDELAELHAYVAKHRKWPDEGQS